MLAALADGKCALRGALAAGDTRSTAAVLRALGVTVGPLTEGARVFRELVTVPPEDYIKALLLP